MVLFAIAVTLVLVNAAFADFTTLPAGAGEGSGVPGYEGARACATIVAAAWRRRFGSFDTATGEPGSGRELTAYNVIADIANIVAGPGHEADSLRLRHQN